MPRNKTGHFYYSWYPTIYQADTQSLTLEEDGAYRRLLDHYMLTRSALPDDDRALARIIGIGIEQWERLKTRVLTYFKPTGLLPGYLKHDFCEEALAIHGARIEKSRLNGKKGGRPKSLKDHDNNPVGSEIETQRKPITEQNIRREERKKEDIPPNPEIRGVIFPVEFERLWKAWPQPRRCEKPNAYKQWLIAVKKSSPSDILNGFAAYLKSSQVATGYAPYPAKWLKEERWKETFEMPRAKGYSI